MPPENLTIRIDKERKLFADKYGFIKGLKPPVHITVYEPFKSLSEIETKLSNLRKITEQQCTFQLNLCNYNFFNPLIKPVVYIALEDCPELKAFQKNVVKELNRIRNDRSILSSYTPHFTIGYRDVTVESFPEIMKEYSQKIFIDSFLCNAIYLWKHNGKNWQVHEEFIFNGKVGDNIVYGQSSLF